MTTQTITIGIKAAIGGFKRGFNTQRSSTRGVTAQTVDQLLHPAGPPAAAELPSDNVPGNNATGSLDDHFSELQRAANYKLFRKELRTRGIWSIVWGVINICVGLGSMETNSINAILALLGVFLTLEGLWLVYSPTPAGLIADGFAILGVGIWNLAITAVNSSGHSGNPGPFEIIGVWQIIWGFQSFGRYARFAKLRQDEPSAETSNQIDQIVSYLKGADMANDPGLIEFSASSLLSRHVWKGRLGEASAAFVSGNDLLLAGREAVSFKNNGKLVFRKTLSATFSIGGRKVSGTISPDAFQRYEAWKTGGMVNTAKAADLRWYHFVVALVLPYIGLPWGIVNLARKRRRSGLAMTIISSVWILLFIFINIASSRSR